MAKLTRNAARCLRCDTTIESLHRHHFVTCPCGNLSVDGGQAYERRCYRDGPGTWENLTEYDGEPAPPPWANE